MPALCQPARTSWAAATLGNLANSHVSLNTVDIGMAQLAMHSSYETAGVLDLGYMIAGMEAFYNSAVVAECDGTYEIHK